MKNFLCAAAISAIALMPINGVAQVSVNINIGNPPPPPRYEVIPAPRYGYIWIPGYWDWDGQYHVWAKGHWERERPGQQFQHPEWWHGNNGWELHRGGWHQDIEHKHHGWHEHKNKRHKENDDH